MKSLKENIIFSLISVFLCVISPNLLLAQFGSDRFQSVVVDDKLEPIGGAYIKNVRSNEFAITDTSGFFSIESKKDDRLIISAMGYELQHIYVNDRSTAFIQMTPIIFILKQVDVYDFKSWEAFKKEFLEIEVPGEKVNIKGLPNGSPSQKPIYVRSNTFEKKPSPFLILLNPFSFIAYHINDDEIQKRKVWDMMKLENKERAYWKVMNTDSIQSWVNIPDSTLQEFIIYCNKKIDNKGLGETYYYKEKILELYPDYLHEIQDEK